MTDDISGDVTGCPDDGPGTDVCASTGRMPPTSATPANAHVSSPGRQHRCRARRPARALAGFGRVLFGRHAVASTRRRAERLNVATGLPVFASDNISSSAYATEEIMRVLALGRRRARWC